MLRHMGPKWPGNSLAWMEKAHFSVSKLDSSCCNLHAHSDPRKSTVLKPSSAQFRVYSL